MRRRSQCAGGGGAFRAADPAGAADLGEAGRRRAVARYGIRRLVADRRVYLKN